MKIKCYTVVSPSHRELLDKIMLPSFPNNPNMEMNIKYIPQLCPSSEFESEGWHAVMIHKAQCFYDALIDLKENEAMMFIDTDILHVTDWYNDIVEQIKDVDLVVQNDFGGMLNSGFFCAKKTTETEALFRAVRLFINDYTNEQKALSNFCLNHKKYRELLNLKWKFLPKTFWTYGENFRHFDGTDDFKLPENIKIAHFNWTKTFALKMELFKLVKEKLK